jgi:hypothetical protein
MTAPYGTVQQVADLAKMWTNDGAFYDAGDLYIDETNPSLATVQGWIESLSRQFDVALANQWFVIPVDPAVNPEAYTAISQYVVSLVADLVHAANSSGRFFTERAVERGVSPMKAILSDISNYVQQNSDGFVGMGLVQRRRESITKVASIRYIGKTLD